MIFSGRPFLLPLLLAGLILVCFASEGEAQGDQREIRATASRFAKALDKEDWAKALELGHRLVELSPRNHVHPYNLACAYARSGDKAGALEWLANATRAGFSNPELMEDDPDLDSVRQEEGFSLALKAARYNYQKARELFAEMAAESEPIIWLPDEIKEGDTLPLLMLLHGYGDNADSFAGFFREFAQKERLILVAPRAVVPTGPNGFEWATPADTAVLVDRALEAVKSQHPVDESRMALLGFSQGGAMAFHLALEEPFRFQGAIPVAGRYSPAASTRLQKERVEMPRFFLMVGSDDGAVESNRQAMKDLPAVGVATKLAVYPRVGHSFPSYWQGEVRKALKFIFQSEKK